MIGNIIRTIRIKEGKNITEFAKELSISRSYLSKIENGQTGFPRNSNLQKVKPELLEILSRRSNYSYDELMKKCGYEVPYKNERILLERFSKLSEKKQQFIKRVMIELESLPDS